MFLINAAVAVVSGLLSYYSFTFFCSIVLPRWVIPPLGSYFNVVASFEYPKRFDTVSAVYT